MNAKRKRKTLNKRKRDTPSYRTAFQPRERERETFKETHIVDGEITQWKIIILHFSARNALNRKACRGKKTFYDVFHDDAIARTGDFANLLRRRFVRRGPINNN